VLWLDAMDERRDRSLDHLRLVVEGEPVEGAGSGFQLKSRLVAGGGMVDDALKAVRERYHQQCFSLMGWHQGCRPVNISQVR
jgi:hypothetical protein